MEGILGEFLDWKQESLAKEAAEATAAATPGGPSNLLGGFPVRYYIHTKTHNNMIRSVLGFTAMCRHYLAKFPHEKVPQWRVNDDVIEG
jgi:hypothetical protein